MNDTEAKPQTPMQAEDLVFEYKLDAPPEKVWRAISIPAFREKWLPDAALVDAEPVSAAPGEEVRYRMREDEPPFLESVVTFQVGVSADGGSRLRIIHRLMPARLALRPPAAANSNWPCLMRAA